MLLHFSAFRGHRVLSSSSSGKIRTSSGQPYCTAVHIHVQHSVKCKDSRPWGAWPLPHKGSLHWAFLEYRNGKEYSFSSRFLTLQLEIVTIGVFSWGKYTHKKFSSAITLWRKNILTAMIFRLQLVKSSWSIAWCNDN